AWPILGGDNEADVRQTQFGRPEARRAPSKPGRRTKSAVGDFFPVGYTEKLSPQPHSPFTLGLRKRKASFSPCFTKSTWVPSMSDRLSASTKTFTPRSSKTRSFGWTSSA